MIELFDELTNAHKRILTILDLKLALTLVSRCLALEGLENQCLALKWLENRCFLLSGMSVLDSG